MHRARRFAVAECGLTGALGVQAGRLARHSISKQSDRRRRREGRPQTARPRRWSGWWTPTSGQGRLTNLDQVAVGIADVAANLGLMLLGRRQELGAPRAPLRVHSLDVRNPDVEEAAHPIWVGLRLERDGRLVVRRTSSEVDDDPDLG